LTDYQGCGGGATRAIRQLPARLTPGQAKELRRFSNSCAVPDIVPSGLYSHPSDENLSLGAPDQKKPLETIGSALNQLENRYRGNSSAISRPS
jgi:hypothetical protein